VGENRSRATADTGLGEIAVGGYEHRFELSEVQRRGRDLRRGDDLLRGDGGLWL
jgi:hypothetical protein